MDLVSVWKNWFIGNCRLLDKLVRSTLCSRSLGVIYLALVNRIRAASIPILMHVLCDVILLGLLVALLSGLVDRVICYILASHHGKLAH